MAADDGGSGTCVVAVSNSMVLDTTNDGNVLFGTKMFVTNVGTNVSKITSINIDPPVSYYLLAFTCVNKPQEYVSERSAGPTGID